MSALCNIVDCDSLMLAVEAWMRSAMGKTSDELTGFSTVEEASISYEVQCTDRFSWQSIFKGALRQNGDCIAIAVTSVVDPDDFQPFDCSFRITQDALAKGLLMMDGDCISIRVAEVSAVPFDCTDKIVDVWTLVRRAILIDANGVMALAVNNLGAFSSCEKTCDPVYFSTLFARTDTGTAVNIVDATPVVENNLLLEDGTAILLEDGTKIDLE